MMQPAKYSASKTFRKLEKPRPPKWLLGSALTLVPQAQLPAATQFKQAQLVPQAQTQADVGHQVLQQLELLVRNLITDNIDMTTSNEILKVCNDLKTSGPLIDSRHAAQLDRCFVELRNTAGDERFDLQCRLRLLEIIELRSMGWKSDENFETNYRNKLIKAEAYETCLSIVKKPTYSIASPSHEVNVTVGDQGSSSSASSAELSAYPFAPIVGPAAAPVSVLGPGEVMKSSGKYVKPTLVPVKNHFKDEVVIRNSDSGKVMGIKGRRVHMIEELSGTIVSFQRVIPGAKDRLVQLTGPTENAIGIGKGLIEETIRRNVSPIREMPNPIQMSKSASHLAITPLGRALDMDRYNQAKILAHSLSMNDANIGEYQYSVAVGHDSLKLSSTRLELVRIAKIVLEEYFAGDAKRTLLESVDDADDDDDDDDSLESLNRGPPATMPPPPPPPPSSTPTSSLSLNITVNSSATKQEQNTVGVSRPTSLTKSSSLASMPSAPAVPARRFQVGDPQPCGRSSKVVQSSTIDVLAEAQTSNDHREQISPTKKIPYNRGLLLYYSLSPYSRATPRDLPKIIQNMPNILKKTPEFFDPDKIKNLDSSSADLMSGFEKHWEPRLRSSRSSHELATTPTSDKT